MGNQRESDLAQARITFAEGLVLREAQRRPGRPTDPSRFIKATFGASAS